MSTATYISTQHKMQITHTVIHKQCPYTTLPYTDAAYPQSSPLARCDDSPTQQILQFQGSDTEDFHLCKEIRRRKSFKDMFLQVRYEINSLHGTVGSVIQPVTRILNLKCFQFSECILKVRTVHKTQRSICTGRVFRSQSSLQFGVKCWLTKLNLLDTAFIKGLLMAQEF